MTAGATTRSPTASPSHHVNQMDPSGRDAGRGPDGGGAGVAEGKPQAELAGDEVPGGEARQQSQASELGVRLHSIQGRGWPWGSNSPACRSSHTVHRRPGKRNGGRRRKAQGVEAGASPRNRRNTRFSGERSARRFT